MRFNLTPIARRKLLINNVLACLYLGKRRFLQTETKEGLICIKDKHAKIWIPAEERIGLYRRGIILRQRRVAYEYGVEVEYPFGPYDTVIDIGANVGEFALALSPHARRIIAIEPDPDCFACLVKNTQHMDNITAVQTILWFEKTELEFHTAPKSADSSVFEPDSGDVGVTVTLPARTLDSLCDQLGLSDISLIKRDAEGAEPEVLRGAIDTLAHTNLVAIDTGPERGGARTHQSCAAILNEHGFTVSDTMPSQRHITIGRRMS